MADEFTIGELMYCLLQDIQDYLMYYDNDDLDDIVEKLDDIKTHYDSDTLTQLDVARLEMIQTYFDHEGFNQFALDTNEIIKRLQK